MSYKDNDILEKLAIMDKQNAYIQSVHTQLEFIEGVNEKLKRSLIDLANDNRELLNHNFKASIIERAQ